MPRDLASASAFLKEASEMSIDTNLAPGFFGATMTVWAPMPQPASSTVEPSGKVVSWWRRPFRQFAWSSRRVDSLLEYPWTYQALIQHISLTNRFFVHKRCAKIMVGEGGRVSYGAALR